MISDSSFHGPTGIIMLDPKTNIRHQGSIIFWDCAFNLFQVFTQNPPKKSNLFNFHTNKKQNQHQKKKKNTNLEQQNLDLSEGDQKTLLEFRVEVEKPSGSSEITAGSG